MNCGCRIVKPTQDEFFVPQIEFCSLHKAAPDLLAAIKPLLKRHITLHASAPWWREQKEAAEKAIAACEEAGE
jgi:hypothetical protein